jgi:EAL domain-containing protein (putative c-di-GMP-specific phosphodiesterase class I)
VAESFCRVAEDLVRAGAGEALLWEGYELTSHFQPLYSVRREACLGYEALIRAQTPDRRPVSPVALFADAFANGRGVQLDWICRALHLRNFARIDPGDRKLYLNVHPEAAVQDSGSAKEFGDLARFYGVAPRRLCVEILEDGCADEPLLRKVVAAYRALGCGIAVDDFGLGRSNFDRIASLRPDLVKIDRSILSASAGDGKPRRMLPSIVELLHDAGSQVAVEGVESAHEALLALEAGADQLQGHYFAAPAAGLGAESFGSSIIVRLARMRATGIAATG